MTQADTNKVEALDSLINEVNNVYTEHHDDLLMTAVLSKIETELENTIEHIKRARK